MAVLGGAVLGGGSGGRLETGLSWAQMALDLGGAALVSLTDLADDDTVVVIGAYTRSLKPTRHLPLRFFQRAIDLLWHNTKGTFHGIANCGSGALLTQIGWLESALTGIPLVDVVIGQGLHPAPVRGLLRLGARETRSMSLAYVGVFDNGAYIESFAFGPAAAFTRALDERSGLLPDAFALAVGPLSSGWLRQHGTLGLVQRAVQVGEILLQKAPTGGREAAEAIAQVLQGTMIGFGTITEIHAPTENEDEYVVHIWDDRNIPLTLTFHHAYVELIGAEETLARFPDLIITLGTGGIPLSMEELTVGQEVYIVVVPAESIYRPS